MLVLQRAWQYFPPAFSLYFRIPSLMPVLALLNWISAYVAMELLLPQTWSQAPAWLFATVISAILETPFVMAGFELAQSRTPAWNRLNPFTPPGLRISAFNLLVQLPLGLAALAFKHWDGMLVLFAVLAFLLYLIYLARLTYTAMEIIHLGKGLMAAMIGSFEISRSHVWFLTRFILLSILPVAMVSSIADACFGETLGLFIDAGLQVFWLPAVSIAGALISYHAYGTEAAL